MPQPRNSLLPLTPGPFQRRGYTCSPQAGFLSLPMKGKFLGKVFGPIRSGPLSLVTGPSPTPVPQLFDVRAQVMGTLPWALAT